MNYVLLRGMRRQGLIKDVLHEMGCLAISRVSSELELCGRLWEFELNSGVTCGCKLRSDSCGGKRDNLPNKHTQLLQELLVMRQLVIS